MVTSIHRSYPQEGKVIDFPCEPISRVRILIKRLRNHIRYKETKIDINNINLIMIGEEEICIIRVDDISFIALCPINMEYIFVVDRRENYEIFFRGESVDQAVKFIIHYRKNFEICRSSG